jgi:hypothetical protein
MPGLMALKEEIRAFPFVRTGRAFLVLVPFVISFQSHLRIGIQACRLPPNRRISDAALHSTVFID